MPLSCVFEFDRPKPIFYSGEMISGRIHLHTTKEKSCNEIYLRLHGKGKTFWRKGKQRFTKKETYVNTLERDLFRGVLPPGIHTYNFYIQIPLEIPPSCVGKFGYIRYKISLVINRRLRFNNIFKQLITILKFLDLNLLPKYLIPLQGEDINHLCCWPFSLGPVITKLFIPFGGYVPEQIIKYEVHIYNRSNSVVNNIKLTLIQTYTFLANGLFSIEEIRDNVILVCNVHNETVPPKNTRVLNGNILIPSVQTTSEDIGIVKVSYHIRMDIKRGYFLKNSKITIPITIGTVPLAQSITNAEH